MNGPRTSPRGLAAAAAALALAAVPLSAAPAAATVTEVDVIAVTGTDRGLWVLEVGAPGFEALGGALVGAPSIASGFHGMYFFGVGTDSNVWVRSYEDGWAPYGPAGTVCEGATAVVSGSDVAVACRGADGQAYVAQTEEPENGLPAATSWRALGGQVVHGVAVADISDDDSTPAFLYAAVGTDGQAYVRTDTEPWELVGGRCTAPVALHELGGVLGCRGTDSALWVLENAWGSYGGVITGAPGLAWHEDGRVHAYVTGGDSQVWTRTEGTQGWRPLGGITAFGVSVVTVLG